MGPTVLSVPSSSGRTLQHRMTHVGMVHVGPFSSLFIGKDSSTKNSSTKRSLRWTFSSLFIGKDSSTIAGPSWAGRTISFSSLFIGKDSSTVGVEWPRQENPSFSSLFIGKDSSTGSPYGFLALDFHFQFPLHREGLFNFEPIVMVGVNSTAFSSLFIGKDSSTVGVPVIPRQVIHLSVPSSSGRTLQLPT